MVQSDLELSSRSKLLKESGFEVNNEIE